MSHVFLSYAHEDGDFAENLQRRLEADNHAVWTDVAIRGGEQWRVEIDTAIRSASAVIVVMTPDAKQSEYVTYEWGFALGGGVTVIPLLLKPTPLHPRLEEIQHLDFTSRNRPWEDLKALLPKRNARVNPARPLGPLHGYSGEWRIDTTFRLWQGQPVSAPGRVTFQGSMFLLLSEEGKNGAGTQIGTLSVAFVDWAATYRVANKIIEAHVTNDGGLHVTCQVLSRTRAKGGEPPPPYSDELFGDRQFQVHLQPVPDSPQRLIGDQNYLAGGDYQRADETYDYVGFAGIGTR